MQKSRGHWVWLVAWAERWKEACAELTPPRRNKPGKSSGSEYLCLGINFLHLLGMWQNETNTVRLSCDFFFFFSQEGHSRLPQSQSSDVSNNNHAKNDIMFLKSSGQF